MKNMIDSEICGFSFEEYNSNLIERNPVVSVWCTTFNHRDYIEQCIQSLTNQIVNFEYEIVIFDDASTDGTSDIVREYSQKYPNLIHALIAKNNTYCNPKRKSIRDYLLSDVFKGKYIAVCEGDDYWSDCNKLNTQINFLLSNPDYSLTFHNAIKRHELQNTETVMKCESFDKELKTEDIIMQYDGMWPTASMVGKKDIFRDSTFLFTNEVGDWPVQLYASHIGKVFYFSKVMSIYRFFSKNSWSSSIYTNNAKRVLNVFNMIELMNRFNKFTSYQHMEFIKLKCGILWSSIYEIIRYTQDNEFNEIISSINKVSAKSEHLLQRIEILKAIRSYLKTKQDKEDINNALIDRIKNKNIYIFCASTAGRNLKSILENHDISICGFIDNDKSKEGKTFESKNVTHLDKLLNKDLSDSIVIIASIDYDVQIQKNLVNTLKCDYISAHNFYGQYFHYITDIKKA